MLAGVFDVHGLGAVAIVALVCGVVFAESGLLVGFWLPGDTVLFPAGLATADPGLGLPFWLLAALAGLSAWLGNELGYVIGRRWGRPALEHRAGRRVGPQTLTRAEHLFSRYGALALVAARFVPWVRTLAPLLAGATRMRRRTFTLATLGGAMVWAVGLVLLGRASAEVPGLRSAAVGVAVTVVAASLVVPMVVGARKRLRARAQQRHSG